MEHGRPAERCVKFSLPVGHVDKVACFGCLNPLIIMTSPSQVENNREENIGVVIMNHNISYLAMVLTEAFETKAIKKRTSITRVEEMVFVFLWAS